MLQALSPTIWFPSAPTFVFLLELLVAGPLPEIGEDLCQLADDNVIGGQRGLCLKEKSPRKRLTPLTGNPSQQQLLWPIQTNAVKQPRC